MAEPSDTRVAVYIDFDNVVISRYEEVHGKKSFAADQARTKSAKPDPKLDPSDPAARERVDVSAIVDYATTFGPVVISRAFADWSVPVNASYSQQLVDRAVDLTQMFPTTARQKNGADIRLSVDVVEDMFRLPDITHVVIVAGDSDFIPLAQRCKRLGRYVIGIGVKDSTSIQLAAACDEFKYYGELPSIAGPAQPIPPGKAPAKPANAKAKAGAEAPTEPTAARKLSATQLLVRAMSLGHDKTDSEWLPSSSVKSQMIRLDSSFNEKSLGFKSFTEFVKSRGAQVEVAKGDPPGRIRLRENATPDAPSATP